MWKRSNSEKEGARGIKGKLGRKSGFEFRERK